MTHKESRPRAAHQTTAKQSSYQTTADDLHAAFLAGVEHGRQERIRLDLADAVQATLHELACEHIGLARQSATERHGAAWADAITEAGEIQ